MAWLFVACVLLWGTNVAKGALPEAGIFTLAFNESVDYNGFVKNCFNQTQLKITLVCQPPDDEDHGVTVDWMIRETQCWNEYTFIQTEPNIYERYFNSPGINENRSGKHYKTVFDISAKCDGSSFVIPLDGGEDHYTIPHDGDFLIVVRIRDLKRGDTAKVTADLKGPHGYLSVVDWPLLPFYICMCIAYVLMGIVWLILCARHWRDLLRIQFWIGAVIFLGMLEKAMFLTEYSNIESTGTQTKALILTAEITSCAKRTLARMLVIIVSLGFGIVKPRLGPTLHRVIGIGALYFVLASIEAYLRVVKPKNDVSSTTMISGVPLAIIDSSICWWVFSALVQTTRTLRLRRNVVKLSLYRHFTNTLIFCVIASILFMLWSIKYHKLEDCLIDWKDLWVDEAFWHLLFSIMLCVIMFLWRPSQNNQRYAFTPLLDNTEDEEDSDDEEDPFFKGKVTMRNVGSKSPRGESPNNVTNPEDDPMKWIEENIPESAENPLPVLDSDEEIETSKFEISKMQ